MERSKHLHDFNLPPGLTWGKQNLLRCMNVNPVPAMPTVDNESSDPEEHNQNRSPPPPPPPPPPRTTVDPRSEMKLTRPRRNLEKKEERLKFSIALSRKEIEEDFIAITGKKPTRKSNKQMKSVQMKLDAVFPGSWLYEVHPDLYKVNENGKI